MTAVNLPSVSIRSLIEAGAHYGHRKRFWHPAMREYLYGVHNGLHIFNLEETKRGLEQAAIFCMTVARKNGTVMFVCTKRSGASLVTEHAERCGMPYVNHRWLGGLLSNFETIRMSMRKMEDYEERTKPANLRLMTKREGLRMLAKLERLRSSLSGVRNMSKLPDALFVVDAGLHHICVNEARKIGIPVAAVVDSNYSPKGIDYVIPGNDDSMNATSIYLQVISESIMIGKKMASGEQPVAAQAS